jgi:hypothetical protein
MKVIQTCNSKMFKEIAKESCRKELTKGKFRNKCIRRKYQKT